ncbi:MAG: GWxTD domain-containing protein [Gemmatimonadaceae bacterium]
MLLFTQSLTAQKPLVDSATAKQIAPSVAIDAALRADSVASAGDSVAAYKMLDSALRANKHNAAAWHKYAMLAWNMARSSRGSAVNHSPQAIRWLIAADTAFHLAVSYAPDSGAYWRDLARFYLNSGNGFQRFRSEDFIEKGARAAERAHDNALSAELADESGMIKWRRYEGVANRALEVGQLDLYSKEQAKKGVQSANDHKVDMGKSFIGFADYTLATEEFHKANELDTSYARARHHLYMALAERKQWGELLKASSEQLKVFPTDDEAWLARGLASQRMNHIEDAADAFEKAFTLMKPAARAAYTRLERILPPTPMEAKGGLPDATRYNKLDPVQRKLTEELIWMLLDPLATTPDNEYRIEFYTRVAFADLRWTSDDLDHRGADTDRGAVHVRYGPPDLELSKPGQFGSVIVWRYNSGLTFTFNAPAMFGVARGPEPDGLKSAVPVLWDNVPIAKLIDTVGIRLTAFRRNADSIDVVVATDIPAARMIKGGELAGDLPFNVNSRVIDARVSVQQVQSTVARVKSSDPPDRISASWVKRLGAGFNVIRVDAFQPDTRHIARGVTSVDQARSTGFGMSDILIGTKPDEGVIAQRWRDVKMRATYGTFNEGDAIGMAWENYQLMPSKGDVHYTVNIVVQPIEGGGVKGVVARVRNSISNAVLGQSKESGGVINVTFPRNSPAKDIVVEAMSLELGSAPIGLYELRVEVTDDVSKAKTFRVTQFQVVK